MTLEPEPGRLTPDRDLVLRMAAGDGNALVELARLGGPLAERIVTASPDVTISTNLGSWVNRTGISRAGLYAGKGIHGAEILRADMNNNNG